MALATERQLFIFALDDVIDASTPDHRYHVVNCFDMMQVRAETAEAENAALRAQLAAQGWRPVTEPPDRAMPVYVIVQADYYPEFEGTWYARTNRGDTVLIDDAVLKWRPRAADSGEGAPQ